MFKLRVITSLACINWLQPNFGGRNDLVSVLHQTLTLAKGRAVPNFPVILRHKGDCSLVVSWGSLSNNKLPYTNYHTLNIIHDLWQFQRNSTSQVPQLLLNFKINFYNKTNTNLSQKFLSLLVIQPLLTYRSIHWLNSCLENGGTSIQL